MKRLLKTVGGTVAITALLAVVGLLLAPSAGAYFGAFHDPADSDGPTIDIRRLTHDDTSTEIVYSLEAYRNLPVGADYEAGWYLDTGSGQYSDAGVTVTFSPFQADVTCGERHSPAAVSLKATGAPTSTTQNSIEVRFQKSALDGCLGATDSSYRYVVYTDNNSLTGVVDDVAPDSFLGGEGITHTLGNNSSPTTTTTAPSSTTTTAPPSTTSTTSPAPASSTTTTSTSTTVVALSSQSAGQASPSTVAPGGSVTVSGDGFSPGTPVSLTLFSEPVSLGTTSADAVGHFSKVVTIPATTPLGAHRIVATGNGRAGSNESSVSISVVGGRLVRTGVSIAMPAVLGLSLLLLGIALSARRRASGVHFR